jgi:thioredoxin-related protein
MRPVVDRLRTQYAGRVDIKEMNLSRGDASVEALADTFGVEYVPTFVFVDRDGTVRASVVGEMSEDAMRAKLDSLK